MAKGLLHGSASMSAVLLGENTRRPAPLSDRLGMGHGYVEEKRVYWGSTLRQVLRKSCNKDGSIKTMG